MKTKSNDKRILPSVGERVKIPVEELEFNVHGNTIWIQGLGGTVLRIKCSGKINISGCTDNVCSHSDLMIDGDINFCLANDIIPTE